MKDEEMAEEYAEEHKEVDWDGFDKNKEELKQGFLAGLKACKPQWHDLQKDPNDLPKEDCEVVNLHENGNKTIQKWKNGNWTNAIVIPVIAWYEIPKYIKE